MKNFKSVVQAIKTREFVDAVIDEVNHTVIVPVQSIPNLYIYIQYKHEGMFSKDTVSKIQLLYTGTKTDLYFDLCHTDSVKTKVIRDFDCAFINGMRITQLLTLVKMKDMKGRKISEWDPSKLFIKMYVITNMVQTDLEKIVSAGGWVGSMNYALCKEKLLKNKVEFDDHTEEVFFSVPVSNQINLVVDFDKNNVDMKAIIISSVPKLIGLHMVTAKRNKFYSVMYNVPKLVCNRRKGALLEVQLDDVPYGTLFKDMLLNVFELTNEYSLPFTHVLDF